MSFDRANIGFGGYLHSAPQNKLARKLAPAQFPVPVTVISPRHGHSCSQNAVHEAIDQDKHSNHLREPTYRPWQDRGARPARVKAVMEPRGTRYGGVPPTNGVIATWADKQLSRHRNSEACTTTSPRSFC